MKVEIERKFLVCGDGFMARATGRRHLIQGYVCRASGRTVRVRIEGGGTAGDFGCGAAAARGWLTIKGRSSADGTSRSEWEYEIPPEEARALMGICVGKVIEKDRYVVPADVVPVGDAVAAGDAALSGEGGSEAGGSAAGEGLCWEVDVFHGAHEGLALAEIELPDADADFVRPEWLGEEVTGDRRYYNSVLSAE